MKSKSVSAKHMVMDKKRKLPSQKISGLITHVSVSPHGDPEGVVIDGSTFVKIPPHSLIKADLLKVGAMVFVDGELVAEEPNQVVHHSRLLVEKTCAADDSVSKKEREKLKEAHKMDLKKRQAIKPDSKGEHVELRGRAVAFGLKPKGELDRIIFDDGTSVHVKDEVEFHAEDIAVGDEFEIQGLRKKFGAQTFIKAEKVKHLV